MLLLYKILKVPRDNPSIAEKTQMEDSRRRAIDGRTLALSG